MIWKTGFWFGVLMAWNFVTLSVAPLVITVQDMDALLVSVLLIIPWCVIEVALIVKFFGSFMELLDNSGKIW